MLVIRNKVSGHQQEVSEDAWRHMGRVRFGKSTMDKLFIVVSNTPHVPVQVSVPRAVLDFKKNKQTETPAAPEGKKSGDESK